MKGKVTKVKKNVRIFSLVSEKVAQGKGPGGLDHQSQDQSHRSRPKMQNFYFQPTCQGHRSQGSRSKVVGQGQSCWQSYKVMQHARCIHNYIIEMKMQYSIDFVMANTCNAHSNFCTYLLWCNRQYKSKAVVCHCLSQQVKVNIIPKAVVPLWWNVMLKCYTISLKSLCTRTNVPFPWHYSSCVTRYTVAFFTINLYI